MLSTDPQIISHNEICGFCAQGPYVGSTMQRIHYGRCPQAIDALHALKRSLLDLTNRQIAEIPSVEDNNSAQDRDSSSIISSLRALSVSEEDW